MTHWYDEKIEALEARIEALEAALRELRPGDEARGDVSFSAYWLRYRIDAALGDDQ